MSNLYDETMSEYKSNERYDKFKPTKGPKDSGNTTQATNNVNVGFKRKLQDIRNSNNESNTLAVNLASKRLQQQRVNLKTNVISTNNTSSLFQTTQNISISNNDNINSAPNSYRSEVTVEISNRLCNSYSNNKTNYYPKATVSSQKLNVTNNKTMRSKNVLQTNPIPSLPPDKMPRKNLAQDRLQRLKREVINSDTKTCVPHSNNPVNNNNNNKASFNLGDHTSPLLRGIKRTAPDTNLECSSAKKQHFQSRETPASNKTLNKQSRTPVPKEKHKVVPLKTDEAEDYSKYFREKMERTASWICNSGNNCWLQTEEIVNKSVSEHSFNLSEQDATAEEMEWTTAEPDENIIDPTTSDKKKIAEDKPSGKLKNLCIVVDTNIFISNLSKLKEIVCMKFPGPHLPILYIPWMVITELDYMKDSTKNEKLKNNIMNSIKFINKNLVQKNSQVLGQTAQEAQNQKTLGPTQDDKIISCCLQVTERYETVILLSNDINLKNKALVHNIRTCSADKIISKVMSSSITNVKTKKIQQKVGLLCSNIICDFAKETYGDVWDKMAMLSTPPWSLIECMRIFNKYWGTMFRDKIMKQFVKTVQDLMNLLKNNKYVADDSKEYIEMVKLCINICIFLKDLEEYRGSIEKVLEEIQKIG